jgi:hypothetical protein
MVRGNNSKICRLVLTESVFVFMVGSHVRCNIQHLHATTMSSRCIGATEGLKRQAVCDHLHAPVVFTSGDSTNTSSNNWRAGGWGPKVLLHIDNQNQAYEERVFWNVTLCGFVNVCRRRAKKVRVARAANLTSRTNYMTSTVTNCIVQKL